ncbi:hypothetical protein C1Y04_30605, partial [Pseudomonas sp. FW306-2-11AC]
LGGKAKDGRRKIRWCGEAFSGTKVNVYLEASKMDRRIFLAAAGGTLCLAAVQPRWKALRAAKSAPDVPLLFGVDYYPDQTDEGLWEDDARLMV